MSGMWIHGYINDSQQCVCARARACVCIVLDIQMHVHLQHHGFIKYLSYLSH